LKLSGEQQTTVFSHVESGGMPNGSQAEVPVLVCESPWIIVVAGLKVSFLATGNLSLIPYPHRVVNKICHI
jgi:hypothetical protein